MSFLALIGLSKVPPWVVELTAALALVTGAVLYFEHRGAAEELGKLQKSSTELIARAQSSIAAQTAAHQADVKANGEKLRAVLDSNTVLQSQLDQRVRDFDAYRRQHPDVPRPSAGPEARGDGECGAQSCGDLAVQLAQRGSDLAYSVGELAATLQACQRDRNELTGSPRTE